MVKISVIVVAYNRKDFIVKAINSLFSQNLEPSDFEVIVVKNYCDKKIDQIISNFGYTNIYSNKVDLSSKILEGINASKGEIITLLEDDDYYSPNRLATIVGIFEAAQPVFYHNNFYFIDRTNSITGSGREFQSFSIDLHIDNLTVFFRKCIYLRVHHNLSSMAFDRRFILPVLKKYEGISTGVDLVLFISALSRGRVVYVDSSKLTYYRRHDSSSNTIIYDPTLNEINVRKDVEILAVLNRLLEDETKSFIIKQVRLILIERYIYISIKNSDFNLLFHRDLKVIFSLLKEKLHYPEVEFFTLFILFFINKIHNGLGKRLLILLDKNRPKRIA